MTTLSVRVFSPSSSPSPFMRRRQRAELELARQFRQATFGAGWTRPGTDRAGTPEERADELHRALANAGPQELLLASTGGWTCNEMLRHVDFNLVSHRRPLVCGYSDVSTLLAALYARTKLEMLHGPSALSSYGEAGGVDTYTQSHLESAISGEAISLHPPDEFTGESRLWDVEDDDRRPRRPSSEWRCVRPGRAAGPALAVNLESLERLTGTPYAPDLRGHVLFLDDVGEPPGRTASRLEHLWQARALDGVAAVVLARMPDGAQSVTQRLEPVFADLGDALGCPVVFDVDFGHTEPRITIPLGREVIVHATGDGVALALEARVAPASAN